MRPGDVITHVNAAPIGDFLDFYIASFSRRYTLTVRRGAESVSLNLTRTPAEDTGVEVGMSDLTPCDNRCVFCFVDQLPPGLRSELYFKDEDYRLSFLHGNYLTLTNIGEEEEARIVEMFLSPLYVSVHATDEAVRARLLGRKPAEGVLGILDRLGTRGIRFHLQVVLVPGYNDGEVLERTLFDLAERAEYVLSVSVVPVGLTAHREGLPRLRPVDREGARRAVRLLRSINGSMRDKTGRGLVYASDELYAIAGIRIPAKEYYDDYAQIENGVGLVRRLRETAGSARVPQCLKGKRVAAVTGKLAAPHVSAIASRLEEQGLEMAVVPVENRLLGPPVTVSGLLAGRDMLEALEGVRADAVILPPNVLNAAGLTLDDLTPEDMENALGLPVVVGDYEIAPALEALASALGGGERTDHGERPSVDGARGHE
jgi:putative radical SAM enzyme (TIGR03279 family)